mmetsp:Transcript_31635/g.43172  ORF Transcript_31635/g.43172 Transcript_31635/m.43172 type:complete len:233 (+) Transcript_31635:141-839(+)
MSGVAGTDIFRSLLDLPHLRGDGAVQQPQSPGASFLQLYHHVWDRVGQRLLRRSQREGQDALHLAEVAQFDGHAVPLDARLPLSGDANQLLDVRSVLHGLHLCQVHLLQGAQLLGGGEQLLRHVGVVVGCRVGVVSEVQCVQLRRQRAAALVQHGDCAAREHCGGALSGGYSGQMGPGGGLRHVNSEGHSLQVLFRTAQLVVHVAEQCLAVLLVLHQLLDAVGGCLALRSGD